MEQTINNNLTTEFTFDLPKPKKRGEKHRDPYDGLRKWSALTHGTGIPLSVLGLVLLLLKCRALGASTMTVASFILYGLSMIGLYTASTVYHTLRTDVKGRIALKKYDHISIYYLIAGSYTPICLLVLPAPEGQMLLACVWAMALAGTFMALFWIHAPRWLSAGIYLFMGWLAAFMMPTLLQHFTSEGFFWLFLGGGLYTLGGVLYAAKWPGRNNPRFGCHEIFHTCVVLGSVAHFFMMYNVVIYYGV